VVETKLHQPVKASMKMMFFMLDDFIEDMVCGGDDEDGEVALDDPKDARWFVVLQRRLNESHTRIPRVLSLVSCGTTRVHLLGIAPESLTDSRIN
jgi:hypothetical protein